MGQDYYNGNHGKLSYYSDSTEEPAKSSSAVESVGEPGFSVGEQETPAESEFIAEDDRPVSLSGIDTTAVEEAVKSGMGKKTIIIAVGLAAVIILASTLAQQIHLNHQQSQTLADYEVQMRISEGERELYAARYEEANELVSQVNDGTYGETPESQKVGKMLYSFADKSGLQEKNFRNIDLTEPQLDIYFDVSEDELKNVMGFTPWANASEDEYRRKYVHYDSPYEWLQAGIQGGEYYPDSHTLVLHVPNAVFEKENGTVKAITTSMPFLDEATSRGISYDVTLTTFMPLAEYCESQGLLPDKTPGAPLGDKPTETTTYFTPENAEYIATKAIQDPNFRILYLPNAEGGKDLSSGGNSNPEVFSEGDFYIAVPLRMKRANAYWENGNSSAFYQVGGEARGK